MTEPEMCRGTSTLTERIPYGEMSAAQQDIAFSLINGSHAASYLWFLAIVLAAVLGSVDGNVGRVTRRLNLRLVRYSLWARLIRLVMYGAMAQSPGHATLGNVFESVSFNLTLIGFVFPVLCYLWARSAIRKENGPPEHQCSTCLYDLSGLPSSDPVCPECGTPLRTER